MTFAIFLIIIAVGLISLWVIALVEVLQTNFTNPTDKLIWICLVVFASFVGSVLWLTWGKANTNTVR